MTARFERLEEGVKGTNGMPYAVTEYACDGNGNLTFVRHPEGGRTYYAYDGDNRVIEMREEEERGEIKNRVAYAYDHAGNLIRETDVHGNEIEYRYDWMDRKISRKTRTAGC